MINSIADLKGKKVVAFQSARKYLGKEFGRAMTGNYSYREMSNQEKQVYKVLLREDVDIAILDESVFQFFHGKMITEGKVSANVEVDAFEIFPFASSRPHFSKEKCATTSTAAWTPFAATGASPRSTGTTWENSSA